MGVTKETIRPGNGQKPKMGNTVQVHYTGTLTNGEMFDSSHKKGRPFKFTVGIGQVIRGWDEGVLDMEVGEKAMLKISSDYAYGPAGAGGGIIPPNADLNFEVELLGIL